MTMLTNTISSTDQARISSMSSFGKRGLCCLTLAMCMIMSPLADLSGEASLVCSAWASKTLHGQLSAMGRNVKTVFFRLNNSKFQVWIKCCIEPRIIWNLFEMLLLFLHFLEVILYPLSIMPCLMFFNKLFEASLLHSFLQKWYFLI